jgi:arylsulfatase A-like enzyme
MRQTLYTAVAVLILVLHAASSSAAAQTTRPVAAIERVVIISIDGGRPDLLLRGDCPTIRSLMEAGSYTFWARTTAMSITLPSHTSMLTGVTPNKHGIFWNDDLPLSEPVYPKFPTVFEVAHTAGYSTAMVAGKIKFKTLDRPGTIDWMWLPEATVDTNFDTAVADHAAEVLREHNPQLLFVHFPGTDVIGHAKGWGSPEQMQEFAVVDHGIGQILRALDELGLRDHTAVLVTADHGGAGRQHGPDDARSRHIPWILAGPGIRRNYDLTLTQIDINTEDTFATACWLLGAPLTRHDIDGKPIREALENRELLQADAGEQKR